MARTNGIVPTRSETDVIVTYAGDPKRPPVLYDDLVAAGTDSPRLENVEIRQQLKFFDYNFHSLKKGLSSALLDVALLMANSSQLKAVIVAGPETKFYPVMMVLLSLSIMIQILVGCVLIWLSRIDINRADEKRHYQAKILTNTLLVAIFFLTVVNVFITSIGISNPPSQLPPN